MDYRGHKWQGKAECHMFDELVWMNVVARLEIVAVEQKMLKLQTIRNCGEIWSHLSENDWQSWKRTSIYERSSGGVRVSVRSSDLPEERSSGGVS